MKIVTLILCAVLPCFAVEDSWSKVKELSSGSEVKILKIGVREPVVGIFSEADDERIILVVKNTQLAVAKLDIEHLHARAAGGKRLKKEVRVEKVDPAAELAKPKPQVAGSRPVPATQSSSTSVSFGNKPGYELIYSKARK